MWVNRSPRLPTDVSAVDATSYASDLIRFNSVSDLDNQDIADYLDQTLCSLGFETEIVSYRDEAGVQKQNVVARKGPRATGGFAYFGHCDVVPATTWHEQEHGPFDPVIRDGRLYGRGSCDMKGSVAAMLAAAEQRSEAELARPLYIVVTADEEVGFHGARHVAADSAIYQEIRDSRPTGVIGEPTLLEVVIAHKGSRGMRIVSRGEAAHSSGSAGRNANLAMIPFLSEMLAIQQETENDPRWQNTLFDPPTLSWNIGINDGQTAMNIKAPRSVCTVYFRAMPNVDATPLIERTRAAAQTNGLDWSLFFEAEPFTIDEDAPTVGQWLRLTQTEQPKRVCYGTDAAVFSELGNIVVCGPGDIAKAHSHDEWISLDQLERGVDLYVRAIDEYCVK